MVINRIAGFHILGRLKHAAAALFVALIVLFLALWPLAMFVGCAAKPRPVTHQPVGSADTTPPGVPYVRHTFYWGEGGSTAVEYEVRP